MPDIHAVWPWVALAVGVAIALGVAAAGLYLWVMKPRHHHTFTYKTHTTSVYKKAGADLPIYRIFRRIGTCTECGYETIEKIDQT